MSHLEYFEFDYTDHKRHHTIEVPTPLSIKLYRFLRIDPCKTFICADHGEIFCKKHGKIDHYATKDETDWAKEVIKATTK